MPLWVSRSSVSETTLEPDYYVEDDIYILMETNKDLRLAFLDVLAVSSTVIGRTGAKKPEGFVLKEVTIELPEIQTSREVGYYTLL